MFYITMILIFLYIIYFTYLILFCQLEKGKFTLKITQINPAHVLLFWRLTNLQRLIEMELNAKLGLVIKL